MTTLPTLRPLARGHLVAASAVLVAALAATNGRYDYHRDELYFRMLEPAWGYVDQPPLTPLLAQGSIAVFGDSLWAVRVPAVLCMVAVLWLAALLAREFGGGEGAQALCAWGLCFAGVAAAFGHLMSTATVDLPIWLAVMLFAVRALLRERPHWWLAAGAAAGIGLYNKHLVVLLVACLGVALLAVGPRRAFARWQLWAGIGLMLLIGSPNLVYQVANDWPQLEMARAVADDGGTEARILLLPFQLLLLGLFLVPIWVAGIAALLRRPEWRPVRALAVAYPVMLVVVLVTGGQMYYPLGLLIALYAAGCVPAAAWARTADRRRTLIVGVAANSAVSAVIALPLLPVGVVGHTPIPAMNSTIPDQVGWQTYVDQIEAVYASLPPEEQAAAIILTSNYGEAGAVDRYGENLPEVYSGHNELHDYGPPPHDATVVVGVQAPPLPTPLLHRYFGSCEAVAYMDNEVGVDNEEQDQMIVVCRDPGREWAQMWPDFRHYD
ncbi:glycosyltransferase family 39 protein [Glycomyces salinus]|uniref:glycosyltransferase family 39 protein n=1 Tax=Glycomyces salinus TaxID=980294 RepID=UPI0018ECD4F5|nr:glycosyltransferase family 39 protein [Glycomyces salinus]